MLWQTLRHDSNIRLMKEDANIPKELKVQIRMIEDN